MTSAAGVYPVGQPGTLAHIFQGSNENRELSHTQSASCTAGHWRTTGSEGGTQRRLEELKLGVLPGSKS